MLPKTFEVQGILHLVLLLNRISFKADGIPTSLTPTSLTPSPQKTLLLHRRLSWIRVSSGPSHPHLRINEPAMVQGDAQEVEDAALGCILEIGDPCESHVDIQTGGQFRQHGHCVVHILEVEMKSMEILNNEHIAYLY